MSRLTGLLLLLALAAGDSASAHVTPVEDVSASPSAEGSGPRRSLQTSWNFKARVGVMSRRFLGQKVSKYPNGIVKQQVCSSPTTCLAADRCVW